MMTMELATWAMALGTFLAVNVALSGEQVRAGVFDRG